MRRFIFILLFIILTDCNVSFAEDQTLQEVPSSTLAGFTDLEAMRRALGLSLGAARVYTKERGFSYSGYAEILYQDYSSTATWRETNLHPVESELPTQKDQEFGLQRGVLFLGYRVNERIVINSEIRMDRDVIERGVATFPEFYDTHGSTTEASLDLAYMDYIFSPALTLRAGVVLVPVGLINEFHTPNEYLGTRAGFGDIYTIPSTWHALGFGIAGHKWKLDYRAYVLNGLNAAGFTEFGMRGGREISFDTISNPAAVFRIDYNPFPGGFLGGSYYIGKSGVFGLDEPVDFKVHTTLKEVHGELRWKGAFARAQYAKALLHESTALNRVLGTSGLNGVGQRIVGGYVEGGYNLLHYKRNGTLLMPYLRGEASNPQDALPEGSIALGLRKNHYLDFIKWILGVEYRPIPVISVKVEYESIHDQNQIFWKEFRIGSSYTF